MADGIRTAVYDSALGIEAYRFQEIVRPFPGHFHDYYVLGCVEDGARILSCQNRRYAIRRGSVLLFNPGDSHGCVQDGGKPLDYRGVNIPQAVMLELAGGWRELPGFSRNVIQAGNTARALRQVHRRLMEGRTAEEALRSLLSLLLRDYGQPLDRCGLEARAEVDAACAFMEQHYASPIRLEQLCRCTGLSKSTLLRAFVKAKAVTPYRYLETLRVGEAKKLLAQGVSPVETALRTGFSDQSHLTNVFSRTMGLAPGAYQASLRGL